MNIQTVYSAILNLSAMDLKKWILHISICSALVKAVSCLSGLAACIMWFCARQVNSLMGTD